MTKWIDQTSYSRDDKARVPQTWSLQIPWVVIVVTRHRDYEPDQWLMRCHQLGFDFHELSAKELADAQREALRTCTERAAEYLKALKAEARS